MFLLCWLCTPSTFNSSPVVTACPVFYCSYMTEVDLLPCSGDSLSCVLMFLRNRDGHVAMVSDVLSITRCWLWVWHSSRSCNVTADSALPMGSTTHQGLLLHYSVQPEITIVALMLRLFLFVSLFVVHAHILLLLYKTFMALNSFPCADMG